MRRKQRNDAPWFPPAGGRIQIEMDSSEYERMREALGGDWEWHGLVRLREGRSIAKLRDEARR